MWVSLGSDGFMLSHLISLYQISEWHFLNKEGNLELVFFYFLKEL